MWQGAWSIAPIETQQLRMLEQLRQAGTQPMTLDQLRAGGIDFPAVVIGELELSGCVIERVSENGKLLGVRLLETEAPDTPTTPPPVDISYTAASAAWVHTLANGRRERPPTQRWKPSARFRPGV